ncbi:MAG: hypothetical protein ACJ76I_04845 [Gaiellaceae bacterium]
MTADPAPSTPHTGRRPNNHQVNRAGRHFVAAELHRRGAEDVVIATRRIDADLTAANAPRTRRIEITVKAKTAGDWQPSTDAGVPHAPEDDPTSFWVLVDLRQSAPRYLIMPSWWIENNIYEEHQAYLGRHGGHRAQSPDSKHHRITDDRVDHWLDRWALLGIFD